MAESSDSKLVNFLCEIGKLKQIPRRGWVLKDISNPETISGHMYRMAVIPLLCCQPDSGLDVNRVIKLCLVHDLAECIVGDITPMDNVSKTDKHRLESAAIARLGKLLPSEGQKALTDLFAEYENQETQEAKLTKDLDRFDMVLQAFQYEKSEYESKAYLPNLEEFFDSERILDAIGNTKLRALISEIMSQRKTFLNSIK